MGLKQVLCIFPENKGHPEGHVPGSLLWSARRRKLWGEAPGKGCTGWLPRVMTWPDWERTLHCQEEQTSPENQDQGVLRVSVKQMGRSHREQLLAPNPD